jgi:hypothetical protein
MTRPANLQLTFICNIFPTVIFRDISSSHGEECDDDFQKLTDISEVPAASIIALKVEAVSTSVTSVNFYQTTQCSIPEDNHLYEFWYLRRCLFSVCKVNLAVFMLALKN